jgi:hypothetical protein
MTANDGFIEQRIIEAVRVLLAGKVNEILGKTQFTIPIIEFTNYAEGNLSPYGLRCGFQGGSAVSPVIAIVSSEQTEKERIIRFDAYSLTITFNFPEMPESELYCYAYSRAVGRATYDNPTLGGVVDRAVIIGKKYLSPKKPNCGDGWGLIVSMRVTIEGVTK